MKKTLLMAGAVALVLAVLPASSAYAGPESKCKACHSFSDQNVVGPGLKGVFGRLAGTHPGFHYKFTKYIKPGKDWRWTEANLRMWILNSKKAIKVLTGNPKARTKMPPQHVKGAKADKIIAFLKGLK